MPIIVVGWPPPNVGHNKWAKKPTNVPKCKYRTSLFSAQTPAREKIAKLKFHKRFWQFEWLEKCVQPQHVLSHFPHFTICDMHNAHRVQIVLNQINTTYLTSGFSPLFEQAPDNRHNINGGSVFRLLCIHLHVVDYIKEISRGERKFTFQMQTAFATKSAWNKRIDR